ncbi:MAG TPA: PilZ domain-containing protein, partial [Pyrinomonadaceae bacterium]|nr:PilZ domain-containing protein [Pyrinomonadaceae bacterium]
MQYDTRQAPRIKVNLPARWEGVLEQREATVTSLSINGCFLLSGGEVRPRELLRIEIDLPDGEPVF